MNVAARADRLSAAFAAETGRPPAGIWAAPGRVNLIGEHTDYNDGFVLPFALDRRTLAAVGIRADRLVRCRSTTAGPAPDIAVDEIRPGAVGGWAAYPLGVLWALRERGVDVPGLDLLIDSDVPTGAGLSSSAALEAAVAIAVAELTAAPLGRTELAAACRRAENDVVGAPTGVMDQMAALLCRAGNALFLDCRSLEVDHVPLDVKRIGLGLVVVNTGAPHALVDSAYADRLRSCERAAQALGVPALRDATVTELDRAGERLDEETRRRARHVITEDTRVLAVVERLRTGDLAAVGALLNESHASMRDDFEISSPELDMAVDAAREAGALGARMTGGGFGGSAIALVPADRVDAVAEAAERAFATAGFRPPDVFPVVPSEGAGRLR